MVNKMEFTSLLKLSQEKSLHLKNKGKGCIHNVKYEGAKGLSVNGKGGVGIGVKQEEAVGITVKGEGVVGIEVKGMELWASELRRGGRGHWREEEGCWQHCCET
jgi:hypothetical protein